MVDQIRPEVPQWDTGNILEFVRRHRRAYRAAPQPLRARESAGYRKGHQQSQHQQTGYRKDHLKAFHSATKLQA
jgi:hypothetical protein